MVIEYCSRTDMGKVRTNNEDNFAIDEELCLYIIADGMGGHNSGEIASKMAVDTIKRNVRYQLENGKPPSEALALSIQLANAAIHEASSNYSENQGMGTTVAAVLLYQDVYYLAWVGDSRVYLVRHSQIQQLTTDHSLVQEQINKGLISREQAENSEFKNILTRALGAAADLEPGLAQTPAFDDDYLLLCTDGLTRAVTDEKILDTVKTLMQVNDICDNLITQANDLGGRDNVTVLIVQKKSESFWNKFIKSIVKM